nr:hypothetical protein [Tanacetum cinerariifolium]
MFNEELRVIKGNKLPLDFKGISRVIQNVIQSNSNRNGNLVAARVEGNASGHNAIAADLDEIKKVNANCTLMTNLQQASTSGTQTDKAPVYDSDGSAEVHNYENCYDNEIFNMFTQEEQYTELRKPIPKLHQVPQNDNNVISEVSSMEQVGEKWNNILQMLRKHVFYMIRYIII